MRSIVFSFFILLLPGEVRSAEPQSARLVISKATQMERDKDRRLILEDELLTERQQLAKAKLAFDALPTEETRAIVHRHTENANALLRELGDTATQRAAKGPGVAARATRLTRTDFKRNVAGTAAFWNPYNRAPDHSDFSTHHRKEIP